MCLCTLGLAKMSLSKIFAEHGFRCRKRWGQNFLVDENILRKITAAARLSPADIVVEIGAGTGALTRALAQNAGLVVAVEIDRRLMPVLAETLKDFDNAELVFRDALALDFDALVKEKAAGRFSPPAAVPTYKVVANIPYSITTPLLLRLLRGRFHFSFLLLMVQQEVARRLVAGPKDGDYGAFSIVVQYYTEPKILFRVPRTVFYPRPEVDSAVVCLERRIEPAVEVPDEDLFFGLVRSAFGQRRKTILNALAGGPATAAAPPGLARGLPRDAWREILQAAGVDPGRRGESLGIEEFAALARQYAQSIAELVPNQPGKK